MNFREIVRAAMKESQTTQKQLSEMAGYKSGPSAISVPLTRNDIYVNTLVRWLDHLGYEVVVQKKTQDRRTDGQMVLTKD